MKRLDSHLEAEGAEFLVLGASLVERIPVQESHTDCRDAT
jgi:hypothetical protein